MCWTLALLTLGGADRLRAHQAPDRTMTAVRLHSLPPRIDGVLDDEIWQVAPVFTGFVQHEPEEGKPATEKTTVQFAYDDDRWNMIRGMLTGYARYYGSLIYREYGEAFISKELLGVASLDGIIIG